MDGSMRPIEGPQDSYGYALWHATLRWQRQLSAALSGLELTPAQFFLLGSLAWLLRQGGGPPRQRDIAEHAGLDPMMTSQVLRALESRKLLVRSEDPEDRRALRLSMTPKGLELFRQAVEKVRAVDRSYFSPLGDKEGERFLASLRTLLSSHA
jgi:DNA-binding MarR family transcriptional regulator